MIGYSILGGTADYFISGEYSEETFATDIALIVGLSAVSVGVGKLMKYGTSKIKANNLFSMKNNLANRELARMGLGSIKIGSKVAKESLSSILSNSGKYFFAEVVENITANSFNNTVNLVFD